MAAAGRRDFGSLRYRLLLAEADVKGARVLLANATDDLKHQRPLGVQPSVIKLTVQRRRAAADHHRARCGRAGCGPPLPRR